MLLPAGFRRHPVDIIIIIIIMPTSTKPQAEKLG